MKKLILHMNTYNQILKVCKQASIDTTKKGTFKPMKMRAIHTFKNPINYKKIGFSNYTAFQIKKLGKLLDILLSQKNNTAPMSGLFEPGPLGDVLKMTASTQIEWFIKGCKTKKINPNHYEYVLGDFHKINFNSKKKIQDDEAKMNRELIISNNERSSENSKTRGTVENPFIGGIMIP